MRGWDDKADRVEGTTEVQIGEAMGTQVFDEVAELCETGQVLGQGFGQVHTHRLTMNDTARTSNPTIKYRRNRYIPSRVAEGMGMCDPQGDTAPRAPALAQTDYSFIFRNPAWILPCSMSPSALSAQQTTIIIALLFLISFSDYFSKGSGAMPLVVLIITTGIAIAK